MPHAPVRRVFGDRLSSPNRNRFGFFVSTALLLCAPLAWGAVTVDSIRSYRLDSVVISADRLGPEPPPYLAARLIRLDLASSPPLTQALRNEPGIIVHSYGAIGSLATVSLRGMDPSETVVLLDGVRLNSIQHGMVDGSKVPLTGLHDATVSSGDAGFDDAAGGVLSLRTATPFSRPSIAATATIGDFGERDYSTHINGGSGGLAGSIDLAIANAQNNFPYLHDGMTALRANADASLKTLVARGSWISGADSLGESSRDGPRHDLLFSAIDSRQGVPGSIEAKINVATQTDANLIAQLRSTWIATSDARFETAISASYARETYTDSSLRLTDSTGLASNSIVRSYSLAGIGSVRITPAVVLRGGVRETFSNASSSDLAKATRWESQLMAGPETAINFDGIVRTLRGEAKLRATIASDQVVGGSSSTRVLPMLSVGVAAVARDRPSLALRLSGATTGRLPTFNDLYWQPGGNPSLRMERSMKGELGVRDVIHESSALTVDLAGYLIDARDKIVWQQVSGAIWSPVNLRHVRVEGATASVGWAPLSWMSLSATEDLSSHIRVDAEFPGDGAAGKQLVYVPQQVLSITLEMHGFDRALTGEISVMHSSHRFTSSDNVSFLPSYTSVDCGLTGRVGFSSLIVHPSLWCINLTNTSYQLIQGYPLPLRAFRFTLSTEFNAH